MPDNLIYYPEKYGYLIIFPKLGQSSESAQGVCNQEKSEQVESRKGEYLKVRAIEIP